MDDDLLRGDLAVQATISSKMPSPAWNHKEEDEKNALADENSTTGFIIDGQNYKSNGGIWKTVSIQQNCADPSLQDISGRDAYPLR